MFQVSERQKGSCFFCPKEQEVVKFVKDGQTVNLCRKCLWKVLQGDGGNGAPKAKPKAVAAEK